AQARAPRFTLFPCTTLFRSSPAAPLAFDLLASFDVYEALQGAPLVMVGGPGGAAGGAEPPRQWASESVMTYLLLPADGRLSAERSEEHTSELQSRENLVCRL